MGPLRKLARDLENENLVPELSEDCVLSQSRASCKKPYTLLLALIHIWWPLSDQRMVSHVAILVADGHQRRVGVMHRKKFGEFSQDVDPEITSPRLVRIHVSGLAELACNHLDPQFKRWLGDQKVLMIENIQMLGPARYKTNVGAWAYAFAPVVGPPPPANAFVPTNTSTGTRSYNNHYGLSGNRENDMKPWHMPLTRKMLVFPAASSAPAAGFEPAFASISSQLENNQPWLLKPPLCFSESRESRRHRWHKVQSREPLFISAPFDVQPH